MSVAIDTEAFRDAFLTLGGGIRNGAHETIKSAVKAAKDSAKATRLFKDGPDAILRSSIEGKMTGPLEGEVTAGAKHAKFVEQGTRPHEIRAKSGGSLRFTVQGQTFFRKVVHHPGTAERPFMAEAAAVGEMTADYGAEYFTDAAISKYDSRE